MEGKDIKVGVPKTDGMRNYMWKGKGPVFGSSHEKISHFVPAETGQMDARVKYYELRGFFDPEQGPDIVGCPRCCADWLLSARELLRAGAPRSAPRPGLHNTSDGAPSSSSYTSSSAPGQRFCGNCGERLNSTRYCTATGQVR